MSAKKCCYKLNLKEGCCQSCGHSFPGPSRTWALSDLQKVTKAHDQIIKLARKSDDPKIQKQIKIADYYSLPVLER